MANLLLVCKIEVWCANHYREITEIRALAVQKTFYRSPDIRPIPSV